MLGREELDQLGREKEALLAESNLNRAILHAELQNLRSGLEWVDEATRTSRQFAPLLLLLAPLAGFVLARSVRRPDSWFKRVVAAVKWAGPLYRLWRSFSSARHGAKAEETAT